MNDKKNNTNLIENKNTNLSNVDTKKIEKIAKDILVKYKRAFEELGKW